MLHGIGLRPISAQDGDFALCGERPKALPLESASPLEKGLDPKPFVTKTGSVCELLSVELRSKTVSLTKQSRPVTPRVTTAAANKKWSVTARVGQKVVRDRLPY